MDFHFRSFADLNQIIVNNLAKNPSNIDLVVGMPRSGLLAANILALHLNCLLADLEGFLEGRLLETGFRLRGKTKTFDECKRVLILEDSIHTGNSIREIKDRVNEKNLDKEIFYGAVFVLPKSKSIVDIYYDICPLPRLFEWNLMHHELLEKSCVDLDGVLCRDPKDHENDDGENYLKFIQNVEPFLFPTVKLGHIVTNRLEKYRQPTESWLTRHGIKYGKLIMLDLPDKKARIEANSYASHKAKAYLETESVLFVESSARQAAEICKMTGRSVYCTDSKEMINPNFLEKNRGRFKRYARKIFNTKEQ